MIDFIQGHVEYIEPDAVIIETVQGIGYRIFCPNPYAYRLKETRRVFTHYHVREDASHLYGFPTREQRNLFRKLLEVSGIGPKGALAIVASAAPQQIAAAVQREDVAFLTKFPGIGKKTAGRIVLDLKDKLKEFAVFAESGFPGTDVAQGSLFAPEPPGGLSSSWEEAGEALRALGYSEQEVNRAMVKLKDEQATTEELIKKALQFFLGSSRQ